MLWLVDVATVDFTQGMVLVFSLQSSHINYIVFSMREEFVYVLLAW